MKFKPETLGFRVLLRPDILKETKSGIVIASSDRNQAINAERGIIVAIGPEAFKAFGFASPFKVGDKVIYSKYGAKLLKDKEADELYMICNDEDILVAIEEELTDE